jgi:hypothetical protein
VLHRACVGRGELRDHRRPQVEVAAGVLLPGADVTAGRAIQPGTRRRAATRRRTPRLAADAVPGTLGRRPRRRSLDEGRRVADHLRQRRHAARSSRRRHRPRSKSSRPGCAPGEAPCWIDSTAGPSRRAWRATPDEEAGAVHIGGDQHS